MRSSWMFVVACALVTACEPLPSSSLPTADEQPCHNDDDCQVRKVAPVRQGACSSRTAAYGSSAKEMDTAACGPMPEMSPNLSEPTFLCFRGTCVPVSSQR